MNYLDEPIIRFVNANGGRTLRSTIKMFGPKPNWQRFIDEGWLKEYAWPGLRAIGLGSKAIEAAKAEDRTLRYLRGPSSVVNNALHADLSGYLKSKGYQRVDIEYRTRTSTLGTSNSHNARMINTSVIVRQALKLPPDLYTPAVARCRTAPDYPWLQLERRETVITRNNKKINKGEVIPGYPSAYVIVENTEKAAERIKKLEKTHREDRTIWQSPVIIMVIDELPHRSLVNALNARYPLLTHAHQNFPYLVPPMPAVQLISWRDLP